MSMTLTPRFENVETTWSKLATIFRHPKIISELDGKTFHDVLRTLSENGVLPLFEKRFNEQGGYEVLSSDRKRDLAILLLSHKADSVALWSTFEEVMAILREANLHPIPIKGTDFALHYYDEAYLRPMVDIDLFFLNLSEAERAYDILVSEGYACREPTRGGDRWLWSRHLPEQQKPKDTHHVELHGGLIFSPRDRRHQKERILLDGLEKVQYNSHTFDVLSPEASVIFALAHTFERHAADPPRLISLYDVLSILKKKGSQFKWDRLYHLARESGFSKTVAYGLSAEKEYLDAPVPEEVIQRFEQSSGAGDARPRLSLTRQAVLSFQEGEAFLNSANLTTTFRRLLFMIFPSKEFIRYRYPNKRRIPIVLLYPYRWWIQYLKLFSLVLERLKPTG